MNILLTSVGRRAYMVKYFKEVVGDRGTVHCCNSDINSVAFEYADKHCISPYIYNEEYIPFLLDYCKKNSIDILLSLFDIDLLVLSKNKKEFETIGTNVIVSDESFIEICNDKWKTYLFLKENGFAVPKTYLSISDAMHSIKTNEISFPLMVKPRFGCGSLSMSVVENEEDLNFFYNKTLKMIDNSYLVYESSSVNEKIIIQELLKGQEYGSDVVNDLSGKNRAIFIKKKIAMRSGETDIAETIYDQKIHDTLLKLSQITNHIGNLDVDIFICNDTPYILEMNARFGGGYPFSHVAGANIPKAIVDWTLGKETDDNNLKIKYGIKAFKELSITQHVE